VVSGATSGSNRRVSPAVLSWLLESNQPAVRARTLVDLLGRKESDPDVRAERARLARVGWARDFFDRQRPEGFWEPRRPKNTPEWMEFLYSMRFTGTNWRALVLSDLGLDATTPRIRKVADLLFRYKLRLGMPFNFFYEEACISANTARMLTRFGYLDDRRVQKLFGWILEDQRANGGWNCSQDTPGTLDVWEPLAAFAAVPKARRSPAMERAIERGIEFYLERRLFREGRPYPPWLRLHYPNHYFYDVLIGLDLVTELGFADDRRLGPALELLLRKRRTDGTWAADRHHPDTGPAGRPDPDYRGARPLVLEPLGAPSKWITLRALRVLARVDAAT
jgi:hypothetical protein